MSRMVSSLAGWPKASTGSMAFVRGVMASSIRSGSMFAVSGPMSRSTGFALSYRMQLPDAMRLNGVVITSSPSLMPKVLFPYVPILHQQPLVLLT